MLLLYQPVLETSAGKAFLQCLQCIENTQSSRARHHFAELQKHCWPDSRSWREFVQWQVLLGFFLLGMLRCLLPEWLQLI